MQSKGIFFETGSVEIRNGRDVFDRGTRTRADPTRSKASRFLKARGAISFDFTAILAIKEGLMNNEDFGRAAFHPHIWNLVCQS